MRQLELTERLIRLKGVPTLGALPPSALASLAASLRPVAFRRGDTVLREDEPPSSFFLVSTGTVTLRRKGRRIGTVQGPGAVGFLSFLARNAGGTSAVAENFVEALELQAEAMEEIFDDHFPVLLETIRFVAQRLIEENKVTPPPPYVPPAVSFDALIGDAELGIVERIFLLRRMRAFSEANVNSLATMAQRMVELRPATGDVLWKTGERAEHSLVVVKGMLDLTWNDGKFVQQIGPGYVVGGAESLVALPRWNTLVAAQPLVVLRGSRDAMIDLFEDDHELGIKFLSMVATLLVTMWDRKAEGGVTSVGGQN
jgi:CRP-like cAMP-binding protein